MKRRCLSSSSLHPHERRVKRVSLEPQETSPMNTDEALKSHCLSQNPSYLKSNNITGTLSSRYQSNFLLGSQRFSGQFLMIPNPGFVDISLHGTMTSTQDTDTASFQFVSPQSHRQQQKPRKIKDKRIISKEQKGKEEQHWTIKKELTKSDVTNVNCRRLTLPRSSVEEHILKHLPPEDSQKIERGKSGITVKVYDHDTGTEHELCLAFQRSYVLKDGWMKTFVERRGLKEGDEVGLFWECSTSKLHFSLLSRAIAKTPAEDPKKGF